MANLDDLRNALAALVALVRGYSPLHGRVRLQKLAYLLQRMGFEPLQHVHFAYHHYGPYSDQLAGVLDQAVASGLVQEREHTTAEQRRQFTYEIDEAHDDLRLLALTDRQRQAISTFHHATKQTHWRTLELAATVIYLERHSRLDRGDALARALKLKPACATYQDQATQLLGTLGL
ncbi:hypothetical protein [Paraliomyxa miuraensis]|uniref:hypothetical protein n=1 Tax=Paraliomyxa miuraensis TaxID=376150 RepID=UPI0022555691|nr:hypothetical protein [Paraliomyxa miuraensis]MCX4239766.1 hypothetical protein [Paraliomyxa miuraensis]